MAPIGVMRTISVYPNPAHDALIIAQSEAPPGSTFELVREDGVVALTATMGFSDLRLDTHTVASGHYVLRLHTPTYEVAEIAVVVVH